MQAKIEVQRTVVVVMSERQACDLVAFLKHLQRQEVSRLTAALGVSEAQTTAVFDTLDQLREELHECTKNIL